MKGDIIMVSETTSVDQSPHQLAFEGLEVGSPARSCSGAGRRRVWSDGAFDAPELALFWERAVSAGASPTTAATELRAMRSSWKAAVRVLGHHVDLVPLLQDPDLLAAAACDADRLDGRSDKDLTYATLAQRRRAVRNFVSLLEDVLKVDAFRHVAVFEAALRDRCESVGELYRLKRGSSTGRKVYTPSWEQYERVVACAPGGPRGYARERNLAWLKLATIGLRAGSMIPIDGADFYTGHHGLCLWVREKMKAEHVSVLIPPDVESALGAYVRTFNVAMLREARPDRIEFGTPGTFWRWGSGRPWSSQAAEKMLRSACKQARVPEFGPQAIRRMVTQGLVRSMQRNDVAEALRWSGVHVLDAHYGPPPGLALKLRS